MRVQACAEQRGGRGAHLHAERALEDILGGERWRGAKDEGWRKGKVVGKGDAHTERHEVVVGLGERLEVLVERARLVKRPVEHLHLPLLQRVVEQPDLDARIARAHGAELLHELRAERACCWIRKMEKISRAARW